MALNQFEVPRAVESRIDRILRPFETFAKVEASGGMLLLLCALAAVAAANSPWSAAYAAPWHIPLKLGIGQATISKPLLFWINDGLMAVFFFVVGLEIKREVLVGELASFRKAALPLVAALGGMVVPAAIYLALNVGSDNASGWAIPTATDIAFAMGLLALLGRRIPLSLKVFLVALAIADDFAAVLVIAVFYTQHLSWIGLSLAGGCCITLIAVNLIGARRPGIYVLLGILLWAALLESGIHPTIAGVLLAMTIPARAHIDTEGFLAQSRAFLTDFEQAGPSRQDQFISENHQVALQAFKTVTVHVQTPMERLEHALHPWIAYAVMPLFALANAGVPLNVHTLLTGGVHPVGLGIMLGLVLGKPLGIVLASWLVVRSGLAVLPAQVAWRQVWGVGWLGGIGFTISLFIAELAFQGSPLLDLAKVAILVSSLIAGGIGWLILRKS